MSQRSNHAEPTDPRIEAALRDYLERVDRGELVNREQFISRHHDIADPLRSFIAAEEELRKLAGPRTPRESAGVTTRPFAALGQETVPPTSQADLSPGGPRSGLPGQFGRYQIIRALGRGAMGAVYLAKDTQLKRNVAIKTPHFEDDPTGELLKRFYREAEAAATLLHANICPVYDVGEIDGRHFISMAYIEGKPLSEVIHSDHAQNERHIVIAVHKLARALQQAHDHGIVHRDLKPANIMVNRQGEPIIMDFGLARKRRAEGEARLTHSGALLGSPAYMSPEQIEGDPESVGPASDQYSLGTVFYEMLTRQLPFRGSVVNVLAQILTKDLTPPSELRAGLDPRIEAVCLRMMAKKASDRFASMKAVADELATIVKNPAAALVPSRRGAGASRTQHSAKQKALTESDVTSLEELIRKCVRHRDYDQVIQIVERIPEERWSDGIRALLTMAREKADEIAFLICEIEEADQLHNARTALKKAEELLKVKPGHHRALAIQEKYSGYGDEGAARIGVLDQFRRPLNDGGWIPWSALAFGLAVFGVMTGVIVIYLNRTVVVIDIQDPDVEVAVKGTTLTVTGPDQQSVKVVPGDQELTISCAGLETITKSFSLKKGEKKTITVSILDSRLMAQLEDEKRLLTPPRPEKASSPTTGHRQQLPPPMLAHEEKTAATLPRTFENSLGMEFVLVPKGKSWLGGGGGKPGDKEVVIAHDFYLGKYEVTQEEWEKAMGLTPSWFSRTGGGKDLIKDIADADLKRFPVENVSWDDAQAFLERLNKAEHETGWVYRLPKEAEWEYACRGGPLLDRSESAYDYYFDKPTNQLLPDQANFDGTGLRRTCRVGSYKPNRVGLYDMHGNVFEWCDDAEKSSDGASRRVDRGGGWNVGSRSVRAAVREATHPPSDLGFLLGLRVARVPLGAGVVKIPADQKKSTAPELSAAHRSPLDPDRLAADSVLSLGGSVTVRVDGREQSIEPGGSLPPEPLGLTQVRLEHLPGLTDAALEPLEVASHLRVVSLNDSPNVGDAGVAHLRTQTGLRELKLEGTRVTDAGMAAVERLSQLKLLAIERTKVTEAGLAHIENLSELQTLWMGNGVRVTDAGLIHLQNLTKLRRITLWGAPLNGSGLKYLKGLKQLEFIALAGTRITDEGLSHLRNFQQLRDLRLGATRVTDAGLSHLRGLTQLTQLDLRATRISNAGLATLKPLRYLRRLGFGQTRISDDGLMQLNGLTELRELLLNETHVSNAGLAHLNHLTELTILDLGKTRVTGAGIENLKVFAKLRTLSLEGTRITDAGLEKLEGMTALQELSLANTNVSAAGMAKLRQSLPACRIDTKAATP